MPASAEMGARGMSAAAPMTAAVRLGQCGCRTCQDRPQHAGRQKKAPALGTHDCHLTLNTDTSDLPYTTRFKLFGAHNVRLIPQCRIEHNVLGPARRRLEKSRIRFIHDHRTHIGSIGEVIKEEVFAEPPMSRFLLEPGP